MITSEEVSLPGGLRVEVLRGGSGPTLVWFHGVMGVTPTDPTLNALAEHFSVVAPVAPGFRDLEELQDLVDVHDLAIHYDDLFEALGLTGVVAVGHSFGAMTAAELAAHYPNRISKLVLVSPIGVWRDDEPMPDLFASTPREMNALLWDDPSSDVAREARGKMTAMHSTEPDEVAQAVSLIQGVASIAAFTWPIPDKGLSKRLRRIGADTLLVWGARDKLVPQSYAKLFLEGLPSATLKVVEDAGHMVPVEAQDEFRSLVVDFAG